MNRIKAINALWILLFSSFAGAQQKAVNQETPTTYYRISVRETASDPAKAQSHRFYLKVYPTAFCSESGDNIFEYKSEIWKAAAKPAYPIDIAFEETVAENTPTELKNALAQDPTMNLSSFEKSCTSAGSQFHRGFKVLLKDDGRSGTSDSTRYFEPRYYGISKFNEYPDEVIEDDVSGVTFTISTEMTKI